MAIMTNVIICIKNPDETFVADQNLALFATFRLSKCQELEAGQVSCNTNVLYNFHRHVIVLKLVSNAFYPHK